MAEEPSAVEHVNVSPSRASVAGCLVLVPLAGGGVSAVLLESNAALLVAGATPFVVIEVVQKVIDFLVQGGNASDWFAGVFARVHVPATVASGSFVAGTQAVAHPWAAIIGVGALLVLLVVARVLRPRQP